MKVGILTLNGYFNYGNRLQNYALQKFLCSLNVEAYTIYHTNIKEKIKNYIKVILPINSNYKKAKKLYKFTKKNIITKYTFNVRNLSKKYDYFISGSDQVWNYNFESFNDDYFLSFSEKSKNIAYAASFGINKIDKFYIKKYRQGLNNFKKISVREIEAQKIIYEIDEKLNVDIVVDPTLLLTSEEWNKLAMKSKIKIPKRYILVYILGTVSEQRKKIIQKISKENNCEIINLTDLNSPFYSCGVEDFLFLEKNAFLIFTDSYHSTIFSIIFSTPFIVFERHDKYQKMNSRIDTLLKLTKLESQFIKNNMENICFNNINFIKAKQLIEIKRIKSIEFLKNSLDIG